MKFKTTTKAIKNSNNIILNVPYCDMQNLLKYHTPLAYNSGVYGWNYDYYNIMTSKNHNIAILTGYRTPSTNRNINYNFNLIREYEQKAYSKNEEVTNALLDELLLKLLEA